MSKAASRVLRSDRAPVVSGGHGEHFAYALSILGHTLGAKAIGVNVTRVPPGKAGFPLHHHRANEEHFFILSGRGTLRIGADTTPVQVHDYIFNPPGDASEAHQLINTGDEDLVYLAFSTTQVPEIVGYPDSGKTGVRIDAGTTAASRFLIRNDGPRAEYYDGEDGAPVAAILGRERGAG
jgi:uncharacterized cupin superfamily protein